MTSARSLRIGEAAFGGLLLVLGITIILDTMAASAAAGRTGIVGPALFPYLIAGGLVAVAVAILRQALRGTTAHAGGLELDLPALALTAAGLAAQFLLIEFMGWVPTAALLFMAVARAFGSRRPWLDLAIGLALGAGTFAVFTYGLDLHLPEGTVLELFAPPDAD